MTDCCTGAPSATMIKIDNNTQVTRAELRILNLNRENSTSDESYRTRSYMSGAVRAGCDAKKREALTDQHSVVHDHPTYSLYTWTSQAVRYNRLVVDPVAAGMGYLVSMPLLQHRRRMMSTAT